MSIRSDVSQPVNAIDQARLHLLAAQAMLPDIPTAYAFSPPASTATVTITEDSRSWIFLQANVAITVNLPPINRPNPDSTPERILYIRVISGSSVVTLTAASGDVTQPASLLLSPGASRTGVWLISHYPSRTWYVLADTNL